MRIRKYTEQRFEVILNEDEAALLRQMLQNPLQGIHATDEPENERCLRRDLYNGLMPRS